MRNATIAFNKEQLLAQSKNPNSVKKSALLKRISIPYEVMENDTKIRIQIFDPSKYNGEYPKCEDA